MQPCIHAYGPQNDALRVSSSDQHLNYFEALSFLAPEESLESIINLVYTFLTKILHIEEKKLFVTIHEDDDKAFNGWARHFPQDHIFRMSKDSNYWQDDKEPKIHGRSTEIFVDNRPLSQHRATAPTKKDFQTGNMLEITNIVSSTVTPPSVLSTPTSSQVRPMLFKGGSASRFTAAQSFAPSVFEADQIAPITKKVKMLTGIPYTTADQKTKAAIRTVVDNTRTIVVLIATGAKPSDQTEAGGVLRNLIPQAVAAEKALTSKSILADVAKAVTKTMAPTHPQIRKNQTKIVATVKTQSAKARKAGTANQ